MLLQPPIFTRVYTLLPYTTLFRSARNEVPRLFLRRRPLLRARLRAARFLASYDSRIRGVDVAGLRRLQPPKRTGAGIVVRGRPLHPGAELDRDRDRKSTRLNSSH